MMNFIFFEICFLFLIIFFCSKAIYNVNSFTSLPITGNLSGAGPLVSVLIPARNEEMNIEKCLDSLSHQVYPNLEIIVIDDQSVDRTLAIVQEFAQKNPRIKFIRTDTLPEGWVGKCWALYQGAQIAKGKWFLFSDADVIHHPFTVNSAYEYANKKSIDFLTLKFQLIVKTFWEKIVPPAIYFIKEWFAPSSKEVNNSRFSSVQARGDFIFVNADVYKKIGGHKSIQSEIFESAALMRIFKKAQYKVALLNGSHIITVRKFKNLTDIINSFVKLHYFLFDSLPNIIFFFAIILSLLCILISFVFVMFVLAFPSPKLELKLILFPSIQIFILYCSAMAFYKKEGFSFLYALAFPLGIMVDIYIILKAGFDILCKHKKYWRGRVY